MRKRIWTAKRCDLQVQIPTCLGCGVAAYMLMLFVASVEDAEPIDHQADEDSSGSGAVEEESAEEEKYIVKNKDTGEVFDIRDLVKQPVDSYTIFPTDFTPPATDEEVPFYQHTDNMMAILRVCVWLRTNSGQANQDAPTFTDETASQIPHKEQTPRSHQEKSRAGESLQVSRATANKSHHQTISFS